MIWDMLNNRLFEGVGKIIFVIGYFRERETKRGLSTSLLQAKVGTTLSISLLCLNMCYRMNLTILMWTHLRKKLPWSEKVWQVSKHMYFYVVGNQCCQTYIFKTVYNTLHRRDQREKCALNVIKHTFQANSALLTTKSASTVQKHTLHSVCFIEQLKHSLWSIEHLLPTCFSAG